MPHARADPLLLLDLRGRWMRFWRSRSVRARYDGEGRTEMAGVRQFSDPSVRPPLHRGLTFASRFASLYSASIYSSVCAAKCILVAKCRQYATGWRCEHTTRPSIPNFLSPRQLAAMSKDTPINSSDTFPALCRFTVASGRAAPRAPAAARPFARRNATLRVCQMVTGSVIFRTVRAA
ncbi:hypothetical protein FA95DRAFT_1346562 [Auriscalpium vulgare]|uniref:Uncharacterized protein n=1 Tax=Auriscalpium vulgare TaxID=40419 RepID=A0ACB8RRK3_9AGAM|nr:hypothetical protein FA95DRAFT_1346562 [Auriscalpium vulgare]